METCLTQSRVAGADTGKEGCRDVHARAVRDWLGSVQKCVRGAQGKGRSEQPIGNLYRYDDLHGMAYGGPLREQG